MKFFIYRLISNALTFVLITNRDKWWFLQGNLSERHFFYWDCCLHDQKQSTIIVKTSKTKKCGLFGDVLVLQNCSGIAIGMKGDWPSWTWQNVLKKQSKSKLYKALFTSFKIIGIWATVAWCLFFVASESTNDLLPCEPFSYL